MSDHFTTASGDDGLSEEEIRKTLLAAVEGRNVRNVLIIPPDFTRFDSNAGLITRIYYAHFTSLGANVDILPALGTHFAVSEEQWNVMFAGIPYSKMIVHHWRTDVVKLGDVPSEVVSGITEGLWSDPVPVEVNRLVMDPKYDLVISPGQVVPHEVIGMANHAKNLFVGVGGSGMINASHMIGAVCGMEKAMGRDHTPVRRLFDYGMEHFLYGRRPILFCLTVCTAPGGRIRTHGLFCGEWRACLEAAVKLAHNSNIFSTAKRAYDPIIVDFNRDGKISALQGSGVDLNGDGLADAVFFHRLQRLFGVLGDFPLFFQLLVQQPRLRADVAFAFAVQLHAFFVGFDRRVQGFDAGLSFIHSPFEFGNVRADLYAAARHVFTSFLTVFPRHNPPGRCKGPSPFRASSGLFLPVVVRR